MKTTISLIIMLGVAAASLSAGPTPTPSAAVPQSIEQQRVNVEAALMRVKDTDPLRAKWKMDQYIATGIPITQATQDAVNRAQPTPTPGRTPRPSPSPDGL